MSIPRNRTAIEKAGKTLWDGEAGTTCPVFPFYRHPVFRRLKTLCYGWMPGLFILAIVIQALQLAAALLSLYLVFLLAVVAFLYAVNQHGKLCGTARAVQRLVNGWRFLCPGCLRFGSEQFACGACGAEVEEFLLLTRGLYLNNCPACGATVFREDQHSARARCGYCAGLCDARHHERQVRVFGVLESESLQHLRQWPLIPQPAAAGPCLRGEDGRQLTYVLNLGDPPGVDDPFGPAHAVHALEALWLGETWDDPLSLAQALDRFIRRAQFAAGERQGLPVWVRDAEWDPLARNVLEARFSNVQYGVREEAFLARLGGRARAAGQVCAQAE